MRKIPLTFIPISCYARFVFPRRGLAHDDDQGGGAAIGFCFSRAAAIQTDCSEIRACWRHTRGAATGSAESTPQLLRAGPQKRAVWVVKKRSDAPSNQGTFPVENEQSFAAINAQRSVETLVHAWGNPAHISPLYSKRHSRQGFPARLF